VGPTLIRGLLMHCDARETASDRDWSPGPGAAQVRDIPGGTLVLAQNDKWGLGYLAGTHLYPLAQGTLGEVEAATREVVLFGLPGGVGAALDAWSFEDDSLFRVSTAPMRGTFRILIRPGRRGTLVFVRDDYHVVYLGAGELDELKATADERLARRRDEILRVRCAGQILELNGYGRRGIVGQGLVVYGGVRLMLAQVGLDRFELYCVTPTCTCQLVGEYGGADLESGDLGEIHLSGPAQRDAGRTDHAGGTRPPRQSPHQGSATYRAAAKAPSPHPSPPPLPSPEDYDRLATCLDWRQVPDRGDGVSELVNLYIAFRELVKKDDLENLLLSSPDWQEFIEANTTVRFGHGARTFLRALVRFLSITGLGKTEGRRFRVFFGDLRRHGDSEVWATIRERFSPMTKPKPANATPPPAAPEPAPPPAAPAAAPSSTPSPATAAAAPSSTPSPATEAAALSSTPVTVTAATDPSSTPPTVTEAAAPSSTSSPPTEAATPSSMPPLETQKTPVATPPTFHAPAPSVGPDVPGADNPTDDHGRPGVASMYHGGLATAVREVDVELDLDDPTGAHPRLSYLRDEERLKPVFDRSWTRDAPSQFVGMIRGPPGKK